MYSLRSYAPVVALGSALCLPAAATPAVSASFTFSDGVCAFRVDFDPAKTDGARLKATFVHLANPGPPRELADSLAKQEDIAAIDVAAYRKRCTVHHDRLVGLRLVDRPGLEALRRAELAELDTTCAITAASLAAARGDIVPARAQAPHCSRYVDLLALPPERLKARWNDLVVDLCASSTEVNICAGQLQRSGEGPGSPARRRIALVGRWSECATPDLPDLDVVRERLRALLARQFEARVLSCAR